MGQPFFTIGIPTYNRIELLQESIRSCLWQTFTDFELIIANDYPAVALTTSLLGLHDPRITIINHPQNLGALANMNSLIPKARGKYFVWLSDDDMFDPDFLKAVYENIQRYQDVNAVYTTYRDGKEYLPARMPYQGAGELLSGEEFIGCYLKRLYKIQGWYGIFKTSYFKQYGGMEQLGTAWYSPYSDMVFPLKAASMSAIIFINHPLVFYRVHEGSISVTTTEPQAYSSSQEAFFPLAYDILNHETVRKSIDENLFLLLTWCTGEYFEILRRGHQFTFVRIREYLQMSRQSRQHLRQHRFHYWLMVIRNILCVYKAMFILLLKQKVNGNKHA